jgi:hypothetical protein
MKLREKTTSAISSTINNEQKQWTEAMNETVAHRSEDVTSVKKKDIINVTAQERNIKKQKQFHCSPIEPLGLKKRIYII